MYRRIIIFFTAMVGCLICRLPARAQITNYIVDQFDSNNVSLFVNQNWGMAIPAISWDDSQNAVTALGPNNPGSGSAEWAISWPTTNDQIEVTRLFNHATVLNLTNFSSVSFDLKFWSNSATDGQGSYGSVEIDGIPQSAGWPSAALAIYTSGTGGSNAWIHVSLPVNAAGNASLAAVTGIGLKIQQSQTGANLTGTTRFWIDNLIFSGYPPSPAMGPPQILQLSSAQAWQRLEFQITNVISGSNPFDPAAIALDGTFTLPSGRAVVVPGFWYQSYQRLLSGSTEYDTPNAPAEWRLRFTPPETGAYLLSLTIRTNGQPFETVATNFSVTSNGPPARFGYVGIAAGNEYFETGDGRALPLNGENLAWPNIGTYDYDNWLPAMHNAGENFARIWMSPWSFGIEEAPGTLNNYALDPAWQLDYVLQQAEREGIYLQLTLDYHGMFGTQTDYWGGGNYWAQNPYNSALGGPCINQNAFFTNGAAQNIYQKRLRYLVARYGYSQNLLAWEFFNEIDNEYAYLNATNVAAWHGQMGDWLGTNDPCHHLITTSLTYASAHPEIWSLPEMSYSSEHAYTMTASPLSIAGDAEYFWTAYGKPIMIGEFGTDWRGWNYDNSDPDLRGFREGIWSGALGPSVGTSMPWWWSDIPGYADYSALTAILGPTGWGQGRWTAMGFNDAAKVNAIGLVGAGEALVYVVAGDANFPAGGTNALLPVLSGQAIVLTNWPEGSYYANWYDPASAAPAGASVSSTTNQTLRLPLPAFAVDLAGVIYSQPRLMALPESPEGAFQMRLAAGIGGKYVIERSGDFANWTPLMTVTNLQGASLIMEIPGTTNAAGFYRARQTN
ncbi:MAG: DUF5060 domain-containing protein [Verrucomicrobiota bacterium]|jgi:hypothetical protein